MSDDIPTVESYTLAAWLAKELAAARRENATLREAAQRLVNVLEVREGSEEWAAFTALLLALAAPAAEETQP